jgi:hypothetical protein
MFLPILLLFLILVLYLLRLLILVLIPVLFLLLGYNSGCDSDSVSASVFNSGLDSGSVSGSDSPFGSGPASVPVSGSPSHSSSDSVLFLEKKYCVTTAKRYVYPGAQFTLALCFLPRKDHYHSCVRTGAYSYFKPEEIIVPLREQLYAHSISTHTPLRHYLPKPEWDEKHYENEYYTKQTPQGTTYIKTNVFTQNHVVNKGACDSEAGNEDDWEDGNGDNYNLDFTVDDIYSSKSGERNNQSKPEYPVDNDEDEVEEFVPSIKVPAMIMYYDKVEPHYCGNLQEQGKYMVCNCCKARHFKDEKLTCSDESKGEYYFHGCCGRGLYAPGKMANFPPVLKNLFMCTDKTKSNEFFSNILELNTLCSFAATITNEAKLKPGGGPPVYKLCGDVHYTVAHPLAADDIVGNASVKPYFSSLFIYDSVDEITEKRREMKIAKGCSTDLIKILSKVTKECSPWTGKLITLREKQMEWEEQDGPMEKHHLHFASPKTIQKQRHKKGEKGTHNVPNNQEVSVLYIGERPHHNTAYVVSIQ